jgi:hypothetical protein
MATNSGWNKKKPFDFLKSHCPIINTAKDKKTPKSGFDR